MCKPTNDPPPAAHQDVVQTLMSVNNLDPNLFRDNDRKASQKSFDKTFVSKLTSQEIHDAIASKSGARTKSAQVRASMYNVLHFKSIYTIKRMHAIEW